MFSKLRHNCVFTVDCTQAWELKRKSNPRRTQMLLSTYISNKIRKASKPQRLMWCHVHYSRPQNHQNLGYPSIKKFGKMKCQVCLMWGSSLRRKLVLLIWAEISNMYLMDAGVQTIHKSCWTDLCYCINFIPNKKKTSQCVV